MANTFPLLEVRNLKTCFDTHLGKVQAVRNISFKLSRGDICGLVGESGSGKSVSALSILRLLQFPGYIEDGEIIFKGQNLLKLNKKDMRKVRGAEIAMIFQDPMTSLNPVYTIGNQIIETIREHRSLSFQDARHEAVEMLRKVGIPGPEERINAYPYQFSGGMRQRVMIAMSLSLSPDLLIADEPTTALDVTIQAQILKIIRDMNREMNMATLFITHDLACVASLCSQIIVLYGGKVMERGSDHDIFFSPHHPYTMGLLQSVPKVRGSERKNRLCPIPGSPPDMLTPPSGCPFAARCPYAMRICQKQMPEEWEVSSGHGASCWLCYPGAPITPDWEEHKGGIRRG